MSIKLSCALTLLACSFASAADWAPLDVKTGVWETTMSSETAGLPPLPQALLDKMTPDQKAKMEAAIKARNGKPTVRRSCVKKEDLTKQAFDFTDKNCKQNVVSGTGSKREIHVDCDQDGGKITGTIRINVVNSENVKADGQMAMTNGGNSMTSNFTGSGKWISAVCTGKED